MRRPIAGRRGRSVRRLLAAVLGLLAVAYLTGPPATAQALPSPRDFVPNLTLECFATTPYEPPQVTLQLRHLNPVLANVPIGEVVLGPREQFCAPVLTDQPGIIPGDVIAYLRYVDLSCYRVKGEAANTKLTLSHLNPVLRSLPKQEIAMAEPEHLCVPVEKRGAPVPYEVLQLVRHIDLLCYRIEPNEPMERELAFAHINPVLTEAIPYHRVKVLQARQLCAPVLKAGDQPTPEVLAVVRWIDLERYDIATEELKPVPLTIRHINPVLERLPVEELRIYPAHQLAVPVAKNDWFPQEDRTIP
ncbi:hypothetical protein [Thermostaphylospora chromogena]|uniref:Uncharacterized protein n=1 Tax=Thermostaphylospora chromogena TaxID=35622 RepID=A0A1H1H6J1_9ACTN|nr:hypothetical protein [Thermostaphylospora chromogena]SDR20983.1 hypothetical protein SAMN04489764_4098 [Thermostaphylospora chromogena]